MLTLKKYVFTPVMALILMYFNTGKAQDYSMFKDSINKITFQKHIEALCNEQLGGRKFGTQGEKKAACYIREQFFNSGLGNAGYDIENYFQNYMLTYDTLINFHIQNQNNSLAYFSDFYTWEFCFLDETSNEDLVYAGFGLDGDNYSDYSNLDVANKWVVVEFNSPIVSNGNIMDYFDFDKSLDNSQMFLKKGIAQQKGTKGIIFRIDSEKYPAFLASNLSVWHYYRSRDKAAINRLIGTYPAIFVRDSAIDSLMGVNTQEFNEETNKLLKKGLPVSNRVTSTVLFQIYKQERHFYSQNVIGILEGKERNIGTIVSAHYDAVKLNDSLFYPGANDNASGTSALLHLADVYSKIVSSGFIPDKSIAFVAFSGEEEGLIGSQQFIESKPFSIDSNAININIDCVGVSETNNDGSERLMFVYENDKDIDTMKTTFSELALKEKQTFTLIFDQNINSSDNASFFYDGIHTMHILTGWGPMHSPQDSPNIIDYENLESATRLLFDVILTYNHFDGTNE